MKQLSPEERASLAQLAMTTLEYGTQQQIDADDGFVKMAKRFLTKKQRDAWDTNAARGTPRERAEDVLKLFGITGVELGE